MELKRQKSSNGANGKIDPKDAYLQKIGQRKGIDNWIVDGSFVRRNLDINFTNFGQHYRFSFIPEREFWIDKEANPNERRFFISHLFAERQAMQEGKSYFDAFDAASAREGEMRAKSRDILAIIDGNEETHREHIHKRLLGKTAGGLDVWVVDGRIVRGILDLKFTEGGHDLVYEYVYKNEVWLDDDLMQKERPYVLLHELHERSLMAGGAAYEEAHRQASELEEKARNDENFLRQNLELLGWKNGNYRSMASAAAEPAK